MEDAADARFNVTDSYENIVARQRRESGPMDRFAEVKPADAWGKTLTDGYSTVSPVAVVQKEFEILLEDGELLNEVVHGLLVKAEQIPSALPLFWRETGPINGHPQVMVQGHPHRVARFEELLNEVQRPLRDGWLVWQDHDEKREVSKIRWIPLEHPSPGPCQSGRCSAEKTSRWALVYLVDEVGSERPTTGVVAVYCASCAVPKGSEFIEEPS
jgi:hypothetical protein